MKLEAPIFILSSERSGTNLLRVLLDNHSMLHGPRAPQLFRIFEPAFPHYSNTESGKSKLLADIDSIVNDEFIDWQVDLSSLKDNDLGMNFLDIWDCVYDLKLRETSKRFIVCKENNLFDYAFELKNYYTDARFIFLYRDVRDVCASWMKVPNGFTNVSSAALNWNKEQLAIIKARDTFGLNMFSVAYEELIAATPQVMSDMLDFLNLPVESTCFETDIEKGKQIDWNVYWKNLGSEVNKNNFKNYLKEFSEDEIRLIEKNAHEGMKLLSYDRETDGKWLPPHQNRLNRAFSYLAKRTAKPWFRKKSIEANDSRQDGFVNKMKEIHKIRYE